MLTASQIGKRAEKQIISFLEKASKDIYVARFADTYDANKGRWGDPYQKKVIITRRPSDMMLVYKGKTYFCEVKATANKKGLSSSLFTEQYAERTKIVKAGGNYLYLVYSVIGEQWYWIEYTQLNEKATWEELENFKVDFPKVSV